MIHKANPDWGTHILMLIKVLENSKGPVAELGMGISSTPLLHALCADQGRFLSSYENDPIFIDMFKKYKTKDHDIRLIKNRDEIMPEWSVVLIDHKPDERRMTEVYRMANSDYLVVHDTENDLYKYNFNSFKYRYDYKKFNVWTTVLSNLHGLNFLHNPIS